jgi:hypothetical protein
MKMSKNILSRLNKIITTYWDITILSIIFLSSVMIVLTPNIERNDDIGYYAQTRSIVIDNDLDLKNEYEYFTSKNILINITKDNNTKKYFGQYPIGVSIFQLPFAYLGNIFAKISGSAQDGYSTPYIYLISLGSSLFGFLGILLSYVIIKRFFPRKIAFISVTGMWLATPLYYYMFLQPSLSHSFSFFSATTFFYVWIYSISENGNLILEKAGYRSKLLSLMLGFLAGLSTLIRYMDGLIAIILVMEFIFLSSIDINRNDGKKIFKLSLNYLIAFLGFIIVISPQGFILNYYHGSLDIINNYGGGFDFTKTIEYFPQILFSSHHGLFSWNPIILFGASGIIYAAIFEKSTSTRNVFVSLFVLFLMYSLLTSSWGENAFGAQSFGHRFFISIIFIFSFGLAYLINRILTNLSNFGYINTKINSSKIIFVVVSIVTGILIIWNFGLMIQYGSRMISSEGPVKISEMAYNNFFRLPSEIVHILKRFLSDRNSFI